MAINQAELNEMCVNTIRMLAVDMIEKANSGHPGMPLGASPMAYVLWSKFLRHNPANPEWVGRDRFILSAGHGSALLYALLYLTGYSLSLEEIKNFRQWNSLTPGHPEYDLCHGVEATTGPLGQGFAMGVGMAIAQRYLKRRYCKSNVSLFDHHIYSIVSDGDLMEGIVSESASLAGHLKLGNLIYLYDDNRISIEGDIQLTFSEDLTKRFESYNWQVLQVNDGNDLDLIEDSINEARMKKNNPTLIRVSTHIGYGSPKVDSSIAHGEPLGAEAIFETRRFFNWPGESFFVPLEVKKSFRKALERGKEWEKEWNDLFSCYQKDYPKESSELLRILKGELPRDWEEDIPFFNKERKSLATRVASGEILNILAKKMPEIIGGSADLAPSTKTTITTSGFMEEDDTSCGRNIHFGVREHAMAAAVNGMALYGGVIPYGSTFFVFSNYCLPSLRLAALMECHSIFIFTHDSLGVGEDGPTHQPIEHLVYLRAMPGMTTIRPADANETIIAWRLALQRKKPCCLILTRQKVPVLETDVYINIREAVRGGYVLSGNQEKKPPQLLLLSTGSEVHLALSASLKFKEIGVSSWVVSMPSWELFQEQSQVYRDKVLPPSIKARLAIEAGSSLGWERWVGSEGGIIGVDCFGKSAPGDEVLNNYGFNLDNVVKKGLELL